MSLQAKVISILENGKKARVKVKPVSNCNGCKACAGLIKANKNGLKEQEITVLTNNFEISENDIVNIELTEYQGSKAAIILYGIPIIGFMSGMFIAPFICSILSIPPTDIIRIIGAAVGFILSVIFIMFYSHSKNSDAFMMHISSKVSNS